MKKFLCSVMAVVMLFSVMLYTRVSAKVTVLNAIGEYSYEVNSSFVFSAPDTGFYVLSSFDNIEPFLRVKHSDGVVDFKTSYESFCILPVTCVRID